MSLYKWPFIDACPYYMNAWQRRGRFFEKYLKLKQTDRWMISFTSPSWMERLKKKRDSVGDAHSVNTVWKVFVTRANGQTFYLNWLTRFKDVHLCGWSTIRTDRDQSFQRKRSARRFVFPYSVRCTVLLEQPIGDRHQIIQSNYWPPLQWELPAFSDLR